MIVPSCITHLIEQVDLGDGVPRVPHQYHHQLHKGIHRVVALGTDGLGECVCVCASI